MRNPFKVELGSLQKRMADIGKTVTLTSINLRLLQYFKPYKWRVLVAVLITIPIGALDGALAYSLKLYIDGVQGHAHLQYSVNLIPFAVVAFTAVQGVLNYCSIYLNGWIGAQVMGDFRKQLFAKLMSLDPFHYDRYSTSGIIQRFYRDPEALQSNMLKNAKQLFQRVFSSLFLCVTLIAISWKLSLIAITVLGLMLYPTVYVRHKIKEMANKNTETSADIVGFYTSIISGIKVILGYNLEKSQIKQFNKAHDELRTWMVKAVQMQGWLTPSMHLIASIGVALIIWQGNTMVSSHELTTGGFVSFIAAMLMLYNPIKNMGLSVISVQMSIQAAGRIFEILDIVPEVKEKPNAKMITGLEDCIEYDHVSFAYVEDLVLKDITLTIKKGETIALVGQSGGGKTTLVNLLPRFYDPWAGGAIRIDGTDLRDMTLESLRRQMAIVTQDNFLFDGSIADNLRAGNPTVSDEEMIQTLEQVHLLDFVQSLPLKLNAPIGERGGLLSGGQKQRLAIARAILKNAPIVILDEATSALDNESEYLVQKAMESLMVNKTVIVIAHRLSTVRHADRILVLTEGKVIEEGTHQELLALNRMYARLYNTQFREQDIPKSDRSSEASAEEFRYAHTG